MIVVPYKSSKLQRGFSRTCALYLVNIDNKDPLEQLLGAWKAPEPRSDLETRILRRIRTGQRPQSAWQRWFVEPWEQAVLSWRQQALATAVAASLAIVVGIGVTMKTQSITQSARQEAAALPLNSLSTLSAGSLRAVYWEMVKQ